MTIDEDEFRRLWMSGASLRNIAGRFRIGRPRAMAFAKSLRLPKRERVDHIPPSEIDDILEAGLTTAQIAEKYGVSRSWASVWRFRRAKERMAEPAVNVSPEEEAASAEGLGLAPWVAARAAEVAPRQGADEGRFRTVAGMLVW